MKLECCSHEWGDSRQSGKRHPVEFIAGYPKIYVRFIINFKTNDKNSYVQKLDKSPLILKEIKDNFHSSLY